MKRKLSKYDDDKYGARGFSRLKAGAIKREIAFDIESSEDLTDWWLSTPHVCCYCNISEKAFQELFLRMHSTKSKDPMVSRLKRLSRNWTVPRLTYERIDSSIGYRFDNMTKSCTVCNFAKGMFIEHFEMMLIGPAIRARIEEALRDKHGKNVLN